MLLGCGDDDEVSVLLSGSRLRLRGSRLSLDLWCGKMAQLGSQNIHMSSVVSRVRCYTRAFRPGDMLKEVAVSSDAFLESSMDTNKRLITPREDARRQTSASETLKKCKKQAYELKALWDVRTKISL